MLKEYLPAEVTEEEIAAAVSRRWRETGAASPKDMGKVMKAALAALAAGGKTVDGKRVNEAVRRKLVGGAARCGFLVARQDRSSSE